jgi:hypothetical protein
MWDVARFAALLQELSWLAEGAAVESEVEGDESPVPGRLAQLVIELGDVLVAMAAEEVSELTSRFQPEASESESVAMAAQPQDAVRRAVQVLDEGGDVLRAGMLHPRHVKRAQRMHDWLCELGAACGAEDDETDEPIERAAAPGAPAVSQEEPMTKDELQALTADLTRSLGPVLGEQVQRAIEPVAAVATETKAAVEKQNGELAELKRTVEAQGERLKQVEAQPAAPAGVTRAVTVTKEQDNGNGQHLPDESHLSLEQRALKGLARKLAGPGNPLIGGRPNIASL